MVKIDVLVRGKYTIQGYSGGTLVQDLPGGKQIITYIHNYKEGVRAEIDADGNAVLFISDEIPHQVNDNAGFTVISLLDLPSVASTS